MKAWNLWNARSVWNLGTFGTVFISCWDLNEATVTVLKETELADFVRNYRPRSYEYAARIQSGQPCFTPELTRAIVHHLHSLQGHKTESGKTLEKAIEASA